MDKEKLKTWLAALDALDAESLPQIRAMLDVYPYCESLWMLYLKNLHLLHDSRFDDELHRSAIYITDRKMAYALLYGLDTYARIPESAVELSSSDRTSELIDAFLGDEPQEEELELAMEYPSDYTEYLLQESSDETENTSSEESLPLNGISLIDDFLEQSKQGAPIIQPESTEKAEPQIVPETSDDDSSEDDSYFTETLAKIYIKQQRYSKALEIIKKLSLKYPKKNIYFADQIRFLEKVIINAKSK